MTVMLPPDDAGIAQAVRLLRASELVAFGTETVYGLGADACNADAVAAVYAAKGRPQFNPLICHYADAASAFAQVQENETARRLAARFWPGPLTMVLPRRANCPVSLLAGAGLESLAVRVPAHPVAHRLLKTFRGPVAAPSANRSGGVSPTSAAHVRASLNGRIAAILDSGPCAVGLESTVIDLTGTPTLLRPGGIIREALESVIGPIRLGTAIEAGQAHASPGMLRSHYAPNLELRLNATKIAPDEALLAFGPAVAGASLSFQLSESEDLAEAAARLFDGLHWLDANAPAQSLRRIAVMRIPENGLGVAINDRLSRAASPRARTE
jgi:L-threonylcarbamoyladenylate synthase